MPNNWRVDAIREALDLSNPLPFKDDDENTVNNQQLPQGPSKAWDESVTEPGFVDLPSGPYEVFGELIIRVIALGKSTLKSRVRGLSGPVIYKGNVAPLD